jgi:hypothetical protein
MTINSNTGRPKFAEQVQYVDMGIGQAVHAAANPLPFSARQQLRSSIRHIL